ncbi:VWA domain-containing protein [Methanosphaera sp. WGK6]|uniref:VWA domain-containing protein n=1 Tax=Methanosphaera sp. WGK6 TaxID=1561964 RepID=UPI00084C9CB3|nr:VWA domain-containing protein [Methanosphaera sp. WGK6]OED29574.1 hypothetical protein NL43_07485 [Methanosphaera sp. WGK6]
MVNKRIIALSNQLRDNGVPVSIRSTQTACNVWDLMKSTNNIREMKTALKSVYIKDHHDDKKFNKIFDELFTNITDETKPDRIEHQYDNSKDDPSIEREDIMGMPEGVESDLPIEAQIPPDFNPELLQQNRIHEKDLLKTDISNINTFDERILDLCRKLGDKIANQRSKRRKRMNTTNIDMQRTIRSNLKNGGKLIQIHTSKPRLHKNKHIFLSDVSGSCDWISSWFFSIIYGCQKSFDKIYSYEFDSEVIDTTESLNSESYTESFTSIAAQRMRRGMIHGQSDMAQSFKEFRDMAPLNHRSIVIILTDCRDWKGKREEGILESATILRDIVQKSAKVIILNPEKKKRWTTPTSCVRDYQNAGAQVHEIRNLEHLAKLITEL